MSPTFIPWATGLPIKEGWLTPLRCLVCPTCHRSPGHFHHDGTLFAVLRCSTPTSHCPVQTWTICKLCPNPKNHSIEGRCQKYYHRQKFHKDASCLPCTSDSKANKDHHVTLTKNHPVQNDIGAEACPTTFDWVEATPSLTPPREVRGIHRNVDPNSDVYFGTELNSALGDGTCGGMEWLVGKSILGRSSFHPINDGFSKLSVRLALKLAEFSIGLSKVQQEQFCNIQKLSFAVEEERKERERGPGKSKGSFFRLPTDHHYLRQVITEGKYAFLRNLPHQSVLTHGRVAYASIVGCIQEQMGHGIPREVPHYLWRLPGNRRWMKTFSEQAPHPDARLVTTHWSNSCEAQAVLRRAQDAVPGINPRDVHLLVWWGDDYESNFCKTDGDTSVHKESLTVGCAPLGGKSLGARAYCYTHPLIIGPKGSYDSYIEVGNFHNKELAQLCCKDYRTGERALPLLLYSQAASMEAGKPMHVPVYAEVLFSLQDQPERRKVNCLLAGNSNNHARFGFNLNYKSLAPSMPSCPRCKDLLKRNAAGVESCSQCYSWYPEHRLSQCSLSLDGLKDTVDTVHNKIVSMELNTRGKVVNAMKGGCFDHRYALIVEQHAHRAIAKRKWEDDGDDSHDDYIRKYPRKFLRAEYPTPFSRPQWSLHKQLDVPMHMLFLGIVKTIQIFLVYWMRAKGLNSGFVQCMEGRLESVGTLSLTFCKSKGYGKTDKFGGMLSENWLANARLLPWIYGPLCFPMRRDPRYREPDVPVEQWSSNQCHLWMAAHGLSKGRKKRDELRREIRRLKSPQQAANLALAEDKCGSMEEMEHLVASTTGLVYRFMSERADLGHVASLHRHVRVFLDAFEAMDRVRRGEGADPHPPFSTVDEIAEEGEEDPDNEDPEDGKEEEIRSALCSDGRINLCCTEEDYVEGEEEEDGGGPKVAEIMREVTSQRTESNRRLPQWVTKYNFVCLPNLAKSIGMFGPARHLWEGGWQGEKGITDSKHATTRGGARREGWASNQMKHELRIGSLRRMKWREEADNSCIGTGKEQTRGFVKKYTNEQEVLAALDSGNPVSARWCSCFGSMGSLVCSLADRSSAYQQEVSISLSANTTRECLGFTYFSLTHRVVRKHQCAYSTPLYCVLLPWIRKSRQEEMFYAVVSHEWSVMSSPGRFQIYSVPGLEYADADLCAEVGCS